MKKILLFVLTAGLLLGLAPLPAAAEVAYPDLDSALPVSYISHPCIEYLVSPSDLGPRAAFCRSPVNTSAWIQIPLPELVDLRPVQSLVSIPTYFSLGWDESSLRFSDSEKKEISWPVGNPTNRLVDVRLQLRLRMSENVGQDDAARMGPVSIAAREPGLVRLFTVDGTGEWGLTGEDADLACKPGVAGTREQANTLLLVPDEWGGINYPLDPIKEESGGHSTFQSTTPSISTIGDPCNDYLLVSLNLAHALMLSGDVRQLSSPASRYLQFNGEGMVFEPGVFAVWTPYAAEIRLDPRTTAILEARMIWADHQVKTIKHDWDCSWEYWDDYDRKDWSLWPGPIYCREVIRATWVSRCQPEGGGDCEDVLYGLGSSDRWWQPIARIYGEGLRLPDGSYDPWYDFSVVEVEASLAPP